MKKELQDKLYTKYPKIFRQKDLPKEESCMYWGIDTEDGWYWLIDSLCSSIQWTIDHNPHLNIPQVEAEQVKQKFGGLRFYFSGGSLDISGMVHYAENLSYKICENCGSIKNVTQTKGYVQSLCEDCIKSL